MGGHRTRGPGGGAAGLAGAVAGQFECPRPQTGRIRVQSQDDLRSPLGDAARQSIAEAPTIRRSRWGGRDILLSPHRDGDRLCLFSHVHPW